MLNYDIKVLDFDIEETSIMAYGSTSKYFDIEVYFDIGSGKVPDVSLETKWRD